MAISSRTENDENNSHILQITDRGNHGNLALSYKGLFEPTYLYGNNAQYERTREAIRAQLAALIPHSQHMSSNDFINLAVISYAVGGGDLRIALKRITQKEHTLMQLLADYIAASLDTFETAEEYEQAINKIKEADEFWNNAAIKFENIEAITDLEHLRQAIKAKAQRTMLNALENHFQYHRYTKARSLERATATTQPFAFTDNVTPQELHLSTVIFAADESIHLQISRANVDSIVIQNPATTNQTLLSTFRIWSPKQHMHLLAYFKTTDLNRYQKFIDYVATQKDAFIAELNQAATFKMANSIWRSWTPYIAEMNCQTLTRIYTCMAKHSEFSAETFFSDIVVCDPTPTGKAYSLLFDYYFMSESKLSYGIAPALSRAIDLARANRDSLAAEKKLLIDVVTYSRQTRIHCNTLAAQYENFLQTWQYQSNAPGTYEKYMKQLNAAYAVEYNVHLSALMRDILRKTYERILFDKVTLLEVTGQESDALTLLTAETLKVNGISSIPKTASRINQRMQALIKKINSDDSNVSSLLNALPGADTAAFVFSGIKESAASLTTGLTALFSPKKNDDPSSSSSSTHSQSSTLSLRNSPSEPSS